MQFLSLYTPAVPSKGPPSQEHIGKMMKLIEEMTQSGVLISTNAILSRNTAMKVTQRNGAITIEDGAIAGSSLMPAAGYALLCASSREELARVSKQFLECAGDGTCEIIQLMDDMPQQK
jgi:hypothetical protein